MNRLNAVALALVSAALLAGCQPDSSTPLKMEQVQTPRIPARLDINGQTWTLIPVSHLPNDWNGDTDCDNREIEYIPDDPDVREILWHEVFHAGACVHGGDEWWNSIHPTANVHPGIHNLADFMNNFTHDNKQFVEWEEN